MPSTRKLAGFHFKGGTGKSSLTCEVSVMLSLLGYRVLVVDGDQQGHVSQGLGFHYHDNHHTLYDCLFNNLPLKDVILPVHEGLDCLPANLSLAAIDTYMQTQTSLKRLTCLDDLFKTVELSYDFILFDTAPSITDLNRSIFVCAHELLVVCDTQPQSVQSLTHIMAYIKGFYHQNNLSPPLIHIIPNKYKDRSLSSVEAMTHLRDNWADFMLPDFAIRKSEDFLKAFTARRPLSLGCKANSIAFEDLAEVVRHIVGLIAPTHQGIYHG